MSDDEYTLEDYIDYHLQPGIKSIGISDFNEVMQSNIEENLEVEQVLYKLRQQFGPNEMIPPLAAKKKGLLAGAVGKAVAADKKNKRNKKIKKKLKGAGKSVLKGGKAAGSAIAKGGKAAGSAIKSGGKSLFAYAKKKKTERKIKQYKDSLDRIDTKLDKKEERLQNKVDKLIKKGNKGMRKQRESVESKCKYLKKQGVDNKVCNDRVDAAGKHKDKIITAGPKKYSEMSTSLEDELIEDEYEETCDKCGEVTSLCDHEFEDQLEEVPIEDAQTLQHLVAFKSKCTNVKERLMKGKGRYIEQLKAYLNGDDNAEVRMFTGKKVKVSSLNPNKESLKSLFESFPSGPHIVECD